MGESLCFSTRSIRLNIEMKGQMESFKNINPLTSPGEVVSVFTSPYLSAGAPALGEAKGFYKRKNDF